MNDNNEKKVYKAVKPTMNTDITIEKENNSTLITIPDPGRSLRHSKQTKMTRPRKVKFLKHLLEHGWNMSASANHVGMTRRGVDYSINADEQFKQAFLEVREAYLDKIEETAFRVATIPTRDGYNDRKLALSAYREQYRNNPEIQINQQINIDNRGQLDNILNKILPKSK